MKAVLLYLLMLALPAIVYFSSVNPIVDNIFTFIIVCLGIIYGIIDIIFLYARLATSEDDWRDKEYESLPRVTWFTKVHTYIVATSLLISVSLCIYFGYITSALVILFIMSPSIWYTIHLYHLPERTAEELKDAEQRKFTRELANKITSEIFKR